MISDLLDLDDRRAIPEEELQLISSAAHPDAEQPLEVLPSSPLQLDLSPDTSKAQTGVELVQATATESATWAQWAEATNIGDIALEQLQADTRVLAARYVSGDPLEVFKDARTLRDQVFGLLEGRQHPRQSAELYAAAGYLCSLLAWISSDMGQLQDADTQGRTAWLCAELSGHSDLRAWVLSTRSKIAFWDGRLREAVNLARRGVTYQSHGTVGMLLSCQEADAWAALGAAAEARAALERASAAREGMVGVDEVGGIFSCSDFRYSNYASAVFLRVGAAEQALHEADQAFVHQQPPQAYGTVAQVRIVQAAAHLALAQPDGALEPLRAVLAMPPHQRLETVASRVRELARDLAHSSMADSEPAILIQREIEEWGRQAARRTLALPQG
ncbi:hypothetical protein [Nonomuraea sp. NPDC052265]|uniref:hypothetical protein n=1 Tax=Nonomuraea sp. NPDC052265 TaxID=3364374 RepID=UPI0037C519B6